MLRLYGGPDGICGIPHPDNPRESQRRERGEQRWGRWSLSPSHSPCRCSLSRLTLNSRRLFKELLMSKSARFIGCGEQSCSPAFF